MTIQMHSCVYYFGIAKDGGPYFLQNQPEEFTTLLFDQLRSGNYKYF
jgi:hypothetical protein